MKTVVVFDVFHKVQSGDMTFLVKVVRDVTTLNGAIEIMGRLVANNPGDRYVIIRKELTHYEHEDVGL